jgi:hypothetical protein
MVDHGMLITRAHELVDKAWDSPSIESWFKKLERDGIPRKTLDPKDILARKQGILDRIQQRGEDCTFLGHV